MQLPQHIIDLVGTLLDEGWSDEEICNAAVLAMKSAKAMPIDYLILSIEKSHAGGLPTR